MAIGAGAAGAWAVNNATTQTVTLPAHAAGNLLVLIAACKASTITSVNQSVATTGWTRAAAFADGTTAAGAGVGSVNQAIFYKIATSSSETNPVVTWGGSQTAAPGIAVALCFTKGATEIWSPPAIVQAATTNATSISVTMGSNPGITAGDWGVIAHTTRDDSALTVPTWSATSATLGTATVFPTTPIADATSNDMAGTAAYRAVTSGTASAAPVVTGTQAAAETGVTCFIRLRVNAETATYAADTFTRTESNGWGTADTGGAWSTTGGTLANYFMSGATGKHNQTGVSTVMHSSLATNIDDSTTLVKVRTDKLATGASQFVYTTPRKNGNDHYRFSFEFTTAAAVKIAIATFVSSVSADIFAPTTIGRETHVANTWFWIRTSVTGTSPTLLKGKIWRDGTSEPSTWDAEVSDSTAGLQIAGGEGLRDFLGAATSNLPVLFEWDDLAVTHPADTATAEVATGTGAAYDATATVSSGTSATTVLATATGAAEGTDAVVAPNAQLSTGTGAANNASAVPGTRASAGVAAATGAALDATATTASTTSAQAEVATATGAALVGAGSIKVRPIVSTIALRGAASVPAGDPTTSFTVGIDAAVAIGDWLYLAFLSRDHTVGTALPTVTDDDPGPTSWVSIYTSGQRQAHVFRKLATGTTAGKTVTVAGCVGSSAGVLKAFSNTIGTTSNLASEGNTSGNETHAGFVATEGGAMHVGLVFNTAAANAVTSLAFATAGATTMTEKLSAGGSDCAVAFGHVLATDSVSGDLTWAQTNAATISLVFAVLPAGPPAGVGAATDVTATTGVAAQTQVATATGAAQDVDPKLAVNAATATASGTAQGTDAAIKVNAGAATGTGAALNATVTTATAGSATAQAATATGSAQAAAGAVKVNAQLASATGAALVADGLPGTRAQATVATATGATADTDPRVAVNTGSAAATGTAANATVSTAAQASANAQVATAQGAAHGATASVPAVTSANAGVATASGTAHNARIVVAVAAAAATGIGSAQAASIAVAVAAYAEAAAGTATAYDAGVALGAAAALAEVATGTGTAYNARVQTAAGSGLESLPGIRGGIVSLPAIRAGIAASPGPRGGIAVAPGVRGGIVTNRRIRGEVDTT